MKLRRCAALASILALTVAAAPPRITVNGAPLDVAPVSQGGRVLVPMRPIFEALRATVTYDSQAHNIAAQGNGHTVRLQIGNENAVVDDHVVLLDVPARVIAASTYVPLRFVAQALGAVVGYDNAAGLVTVSLAQATATKSSQLVGSMLPAPNSSVATGYPTISATIGGSTPVSSAKMVVDGVDVTDLTSFDGTTITYIPQQALRLGTHDVQVVGTDTNDQPFSGSWSFTTTAASADEFDNSAPFQFYLDGGADDYGYGDDMSFVLVGPPGGTAYFTTCASPLRNYMSGNGSYYRATIPAPYGFGNGSCPIEAVYVGARGGRWYSPTPVFAHLHPRQGGHDPHDRPTPRPTSRPTHAPSLETPAPKIARPPRRPIETPRPLPQETFAPTPQPEVTQAPRPEVTPAPSRPRPPHRVPQPKPEPKPKPEPSAAI